MAQLDMWLSTRCSYENPWVSLWNIMEWYIYNIHGGFSIFMLVYWRLYYGIPLTPQWRFQDGKKYSLTSKNHHFWIRLHEGAWWFDGSKAGVVILCSNTQIDRTVEQMELPYIHDMIGGTSSRTSWKNFGTPISYHIYIYIQSTVRLWNHHWSVHVCLTQLHLQLLLIPSIWAIASNSTSYERYHPNSCFLASPLLNTDNYIHMFKPLSIRSISGMGIILNHYLSVVWGSY